MKFVVDASVAIKWAVEEDGRPLARQLLVDGHELVAPDFVLLEVSNILWKKARRGELTDEQAVRALKEIRLPFSRFYETVSFIDRSLDLSLELDHPAYDCLYIALAEHLGIGLATADQRLVRATRASSVSDLVVPLAGIVS